MAEERKIRNRSGFEQCGWCGNEGWLYLRRFTPGKSVRMGPDGEPVTYTWHEQQLAACGFCEKGLLLHERYGGPWRYTWEDIDCWMEPHQVNRLDESARRGYEAMRKMGKSFAERYKDIDLAPQAPDVDSYLVTDQESGTLLGTAVGSVSSHTSDDTEN